VSFKGDCQMRLKMVMGCSGSKDFSQANKNIGLPGLPSSACLARVLRFSLRFSEVVMVRTRNRGMLKLRWWPPVFYHSQ
jgi:hypothetical protein